MRSRTLTFAPWILPLAVPFLAFAAAYAAGPPLLPYLNSRLQSLSTQLTALNTYLAAEQQKQQATLVQTEKLTRSMLSLSRWPQALSTLSAVTDGHVTTPQLLSHLRSQTAQALAARQRQLQTLTNLRQQATQKAATIAALKRQIATGGKKLSVDDKIALYAAATSADQLAIGIQNALAPALESVADPHTVAENLPTPARGSVHMPVNSKPRATTTGLLFLPAPSTSVAAAVGGKVLYAGPFRQFGGLVIIETAPRLQHIFAGLGTLTVKAGQSVAAGQSLGSLPTKAPVHLYWEVRKNGQPLAASKILSL